MILCLWPRRGPRAPGAPCVLPRAMPFFGLVLGLLIALPALAEMPARTITVQGTGSIDAAPDMAYLHVGMMQEADTAAAAMSAIGTLGEAVLGAIEAAGIAPRDIRTGRLNLAPRMIYPDNSAPQVTGFISEVSLEIRLREIGDLGRLLDVVVAAGATRIDGIVFDLADPGRLEDLARLAAVADARDRAQLYADAAGVALGPVIRIDETAGPDGQTPVFGQRLALADSAPVAPGELTRRAQVTMVFAIAQSAD